MVRGPISTLHGVVFANFGPGSAVHRLRDATANARRRERIQAIALESGGSHPPVKNPVLPRQYPFRPQGPDDVVARHGGRSGHMIDAALAPRGALHLHDPSAPQPPVAL